jgi:hypothetical protein
MALPLSDDPERDLAAVYMYWGTNVYVAMNKEATLTQCLTLGWVICTYYL